MASSARLANDDRFAPRHEACPKSGVTQHIASPRGEVEDRRVWVHACKCVGVGAGVLLEIGSETPVLERQYRAAASAPLARDSPRQLEDRAPPDRVAQGDERFSDPLRQREVLIPSKLEPFRRPWTAVPRWCEKGDPSGTQRAPNFGQHALRIRNVLDCCPTEEETDGIVRQRQLLHVSADSTAGVDRQRESG